MTCYISHESIIWTPSHDIKDKSDLIEEGQQYE